MANVPNTDLFFEKLKARFISLGFQEKLAMTVASVIEPVKFEGNTIIADCKSGFYRDTVIKPQMAEISEIARQCWGPEVEIFIRSEPEPSGALPKKKKSSPKIQAYTEGASLFEVAAKTPNLSATGATGTNSSVLPRDKVAQLQNLDEKNARSDKITRNGSVSHSSIGGSPKDLEPVQHLPGAQAAQVLDAPYLSQQAEPQYASGFTTPPPATAPTSNLAVGLRMTGKNARVTSGTSISISDDFEGNTPRRTLIPELTFNTFVRGQSNLVAYSACEAIAKNPGNLTNPVFIYGATGLGKTHLLHSVGNEIQRHHPDSHILYVTSGDFMNELIASIRFSKQEIFRNKYRQCDVLLVDDIQFLENKDTTQLEFFHTFNELYQKRKQIVITSDKYPKDIPNIEERLKSRFLQGLIADIEPPSFEDRVAIIEAKAKMLGLNLSSEVILHISSHVKSNVREIQGVLNNLLMNQSMTGQAPTIDSTNTLLKRVVRMQGSSLDVHMIQKTVAGHFGIKISELMSQNRSQKFVVPRHIAMYLAKELMDSATTEIAEAFGKKDHTTVMHAISKVKELLDKDASTRAVVNELKRKLDQNIP